MEENEGLIKSSLEEFLKVHRIDVSISAIDEIVLSYVISVLDDLRDSAAGKESLDVDGFIEMMEAYVPGFGAIKMEDVCEWMFCLASKLRETYADKQISSSPSFTETLVKSLVSTLSTSVDDVTKNDDGASQATGVSVDERCEQMQTLLELFPSACCVEITHCLTVAKGDTEEAAKLILYRQEIDESLHDAKKKPKRTKKTSLSELDEGKIKQNIVERYSFVDEDDDKRNHRPVLKTHDQKKMVRYRENQVVSTKGERFSEQKKEMTEEMKKTYINLKPAKQYRFH